MDGFARAAINRDSSHAREGKRYLLSADLLRRMPHSTNGNCAESLTKSGTSVLLSAPVIVTLFIIILLIKNGWFGSVAVVGLSWSPVRGKVEFSNRPFA